MKNKEIEELLNIFKELINTYSPDTEPFTIDYDYEIKYSALESLLLYIEQLENNKEKEYVLVGRMQLKTRDYIHQLEKEKRQLKNNRDKAINHLNIFIGDERLSRYDTLKILMYTKKILKGDSDE